MRGSSGVLPSQACMAVESRHPQTPRQSSLTSKSLSGEVKPERIHASPVNAVAQTLEQDVVGPLKVAVGTHNF